MELDPKYYVWSGKRNLVTHSTGADIAVLFFAMLAIEQDRLSDLDPTIKISQRGFESPPMLELKTSIIVAAASS
jgi:hypothetical protein